MSHRLVYLLLVACLFAWPISARAQTDAISLDTVNIQIWPEYDRPAALVIYDFAVSEDTPIPTTITISIPAAADLFVVAVMQDGNLVYKDYTPPTSDGQRLLISLEILDRATHRVEYYIPINKNGQTREFNYTWHNDYNIRAFSISVQQPADATGLKTSPIETAPLPRGSEGLIYYTSAVRELPAGQIFSMNVRYDKSSDTLTAESMAVQPSGGELTPTQPTTWVTYLPAVLGGLGVFLIVGGGLWYWQSGRATSASAPSRRRHAPTLREPEGESDGRVAAYCHQCGRRTQSNDRFCRACGTKMRL